jgi:hypothetical protein
MALDTYTALQTSILDWLGRPGDPLVQPAVPDFIKLFEEEARGRLRTQFNDLTDVELPPITPGNFALPNDCESVRRVVYDGFPLEYLPAWSMDEETVDGQLIGLPLWYTIEGVNLALGPVPDTNLSAFIDYWAGLPALGPTVPSNWLLSHYPSLYLFGSLANAEGYIGNDERVSGWIQQREAGFERIRLEAIAARLGGAPLVQRVDGPTP